MVLPIAIAEQVLQFLPKTLETFAVSILGLYIVVNPSGIASVFLGLTKQRTRSERRWIAFRAALVGGLILTFFALAGTAVLQRLKVTGSALQIAGGIFIFGVAFALARGKEAEFFGALNEREAEGSSHGVAYSPLAVPMIAGPASITVVMTSSAKAGDDPYAWAAILVSILVTCLLCMLSMWRWVRIEEKKGPGFSMLAPRIMGLVLAVIAVQFMIDGVADLLPRFAQVVRESAP